MTKNVLYFCAAFFLAASSNAQQMVQAPPPSDLEIEQARAAMLESQLRYFVAVLRVTEAQLQQYRANDAQNLSRPNETAEWWHAYDTAVQSTQK